MADIFLSYARADQPRIEKLASALEEAGYSLWWDKHIKGGQRFSDDIEQAIEQAGAVIVAWSAASTRSEWVLDEAAIGRDANKLVPVTIDDSLPPIGFRQRQAIDFSQGPDDPAALAALIAALDEKLGQNHEAPQPAKATSGKRPLGLIAAILGIALLAVGGWWFVGRDAAVSEASQTRSVAVLPFTALSTGEEDKFFADGLSEELINRLSSLPDLAVEARSSSFQFRGQDVSLEDIAAQLGVDHLVEGTVRRAGDRARVTARLIRAADGVALWTNEYDVQLDDIIGVQSDIAERVVEALDILLDEAKRARMNDAGLDNVDAFVAQERGIDLFNEAHDGDALLATLAEANAEFELAYRLSPKAWRSAYLAADLYNHAYLDPELIRPAEIDALSLAELNRLYVGKIEQAKRSRPAFIPAEAFDVNTMMRASDWTGLMQANKAALAVTEGCNFLNTDMVFVPFAGLSAEFEANARAATRCDSLNDSTWRHLAASMLYRRDHQDALDIIKEGLRLNPGSSSLHVGAVVASLGLGDKVGAQRYLSSVSNDDYTSVLWAELQVRGVAGDKEWLERAPTLFPQNHRNTMMFMMSAAWLRGDRAEANRIAASMDAREEQHYRLAFVPGMCMCGAPYDIDAAPAFKRKVEQSGFAWNFKAPLDYPLAPVN